MSGIVAATSAAVASVGAGIGAGAAAIGTGLATASAGSIIGGIGALASLGSAAYSILSKPKQASGAAAESQVNASESTAMSARSQLLETAGGAAGSPLAPGQVSNSSSTIFGN